MPEAVKQVAIDTRAKYQAQLDAMGGEEPKVEKEEVVETEVEKEVEKEVVAPKKERVKFERKPRTPKAPAPKKEEETPESKAEKSMEGKKLTVANCRELLAKLKTRREGAKKRVATRKKQGKPAELTTIEVLKKASDNLEKKVETEVNKDGKLQKTTITRSTKEVVDIVATIISGIPTKAERTEYINEVIADLKKLIDKVEPITEKMGMGGGIYSSEELYIVKVYDAKTGELLDMSKRVWAKNLTKAKENAIDDYEYDMQAKYGDYLRFSVEKAPSMFAKGGKIENQYAGRNAKDIWESWNDEQKVHFFTDHKQHPYYNNGNEKFVVSKNDREKYVGMNYEELPRMVKLMISDHVEDGQYAKGGMMADGGEMGDDYVIRGVTIFDNNGESFDRYTVFTPDGSVYGMSSNPKSPQGFNMYIGDRSDIKKGSHLGKKLKFIPKEILQAVVDRMNEDYAKGGMMADGGKLEAGVYRIGKPKRISNNLYEQKIVEIFDNGDIATASDYGRKVADFKSQIYPIINEEQFEEQYRYAKGGKITRNKNKNDYKSMFEFFVENNYQPIGKRDLINMAYESSNGIDSAIPQSMVGDVDNTAYYVYDYQTDKMGELVDLREKLKFSNVKVDVTIVQDDELKYGDDLPSELQNATFHQALNYVFKNDDVEKFAIRPKK
jgi:hypothetical protein